MKHNYLVCIARAAAYRRCAESLKLGWTQDAFKHEEGKTVAKHLLREAAQWEARAKDAPGAPVKETTALPYPPGASQDVAAYPSTNPCRICKSPRETQYFCIEHECFLPDPDGKCPGKIEKAQERAITKPAVDSLAPKLSRQRAVRR